jgi:hypothetical protein
VFSEQGGKSGEGAKVMWRDRCWTRIEFENEHDDKDESMKHVVLSDNTVSVTSDPLVFT